MQPLKGHSYVVTCVAWSSSNARLLVSCSLDGIILTWDVEGARATLRHTLWGHIDTVLSVSVSRDDRFIVSGGEDRTVRVWEVRGGQQVKLMDCHTRDVVSVAWSGDGRYIVSGGEDNIVRVWEVDEQVCVCTHILSAYVSFNKVFYSCIRVHVCTCMDWTECIYIMSV